MKRRGAILPTFALFENPMKTENGKAFVLAAAAKINKANALGTKTTWTTEDHLRALAKTLADAEPQDDLAAQFYDILADVYNMSAFQQWLEKKFAGSGHFVRRDMKSRTTTSSELENMLDAQVIKLPPVAPAKSAEPTAG